MKANEMVRLERGPAVVGSHGISFMKFSDVHRFAEDLVAPFSEQLALCLWDFFMNSKEVVSHYETKMMLVYDVSETFDTYDPSGDAFRQLQAKVVTYLIPEEEMPEEFKTP